MPLQLRLCSLILVYGGKIHFNVEPARDGRNYTKGTPMPTKLEWPADIEKMLRKMAAGQNLCLQRQRAEELRHGMISGEHPVIFRVVMWRAEGRANRLTRKEMARREELVCKTADRGLYWRLVTIIEKRRRKKKTKRFAIVRDFPQRAVAF